MLMQPCNFNASFLSFFMIIKECHIVWYLQTFLFLVLFLFHSHFIFGLLLHFFSIPFEFTCILLPFKTFIPYVHLQIHRNHRNASSFIWKNHYFYLILDALNRIVQQNLDWVALQLIHKILFEMALDNLKDEMVVVQENLSFCKSITFGF